MAKQVDALDLGSSTHHGYVGSNPTEGTQKQHKNTASIAQLVEQRTFNPWVQGSSPCGGTNTPHQQLTRKDTHVYPLAHYLQYAHHPV